MTRGGDLKSGSVGSVGSVEILPILREALSQRPEWRDFSPHQLSVLMFLHGYTETPAEDLDVAAALPIARQDREGAA